MQVIFFVVMLLGLPLAAEFMRSSDASIDVAWRSYTNEQHLAPIYLLGLTHWAPADFYMVLQEFIKGTRVVYEGIGDSLEDRAFIEKKLEQLEAPYRDTFFLLTHFAGLVNVLGQVKQPDIDYSVCLLSCR